MSRPSAYSKALNSPKVLHVNLDAPAAPTLTAILRLYNYDAVHVFTVAEELVWSAMNWPNTVIIDIRDDPTPGWELAKKIAANQPQCKVLILADPDHAPALRKAASNLSHAFHVLPKPIERKDILEFLGSL